MRTKNSLINAIVSTISQILNIVIVFISRRIFLLILGETVLGINSLFMQILSMLSLVELGIGPAIVFSLYKPLAENNKKQISAIMSLYRKIYTYIGIIILGLGLLLTPFIKGFIEGDISSVNNIYLIFILFVVNSSFSYFNSYKQNLMIADQKKYITIIYHYGLFFVLNIIQIIVLLKTGNYILYLILQIIFTLLENIVLSIKTKKMYPYLKQYKSEQVDDETVGQMKKNIRGLLFHKIGGVAVSSTDTLIISKFIGIITVGRYTNYIYVLNAFSTLISQVFSSVTSSIGNFHASESNERTYEVFKKTFLLNFFVFSVISICVFCLIDDFIKIVFGANMVLDLIVVFLLVLKFYMTGMRTALLTFKDALGIYHQDRYRPVVEAIINLVISISLAPTMGLIGVILGTVVSNIVTNLWIEPYVVYRDGFKRKIGSYFKRYFTYFLYLMISGLFVFWLSQFIVIDTFIMLVFKSIVILLIVIILEFIFIYMYNKSETRYFIDLILGFFKKNPSIND